MLTESNCTLYKFNGIGFDRYYIKECHWQECKASNVLKSGTQNADSIKIYIPADSFVLTPDENTVPSRIIFSSLDKTLQNASKDIIIRGECNFTFDNSTDRLASESLKKLREKYEIHTVMSIDSLLYGSPNLQHIKISAK